jgi:hypothetical protein
VVYFPWRFLLRSFCFCLVASPSSYSFHHLPAYGLGDRGIGARFPTGTRDLSLLHSVQTGSGTHPASYLICVGSGV